MTEEQILSGAKAAQDICDAILKASGDAMMQRASSHADGALLAAGFVLALRQIDTIDPMVSQTVRVALSKGVQ